MGLISPFLRIMGGLPTRMWTSLHPWSTALFSTCTRSMVPPAGPAGDAAPRMVAPFGLAMDGRADDKLVRSGAHGSPPQAQDARRQINREAPQPWRGLRPHGRQQDRTEPPHGVTVPDSVRRRPPCPLPADTL